MGTSRLRDQRSPSSPGRRDALGAERRRSLLDDQETARSPPGALAHFYRGDFKLSPQSAQAKLTKLRSSKAYQAGDRSAIDRGRLLGMLATRAGGGWQPQKQQSGGVP